jgi:hypothetical protein
MSGVTGSAIEWCTMVGYHALQTNRKDKRTSAGAPQRALVFSLVVALKWEEFSWADAETVDAYIVREIETLLITGIQEPSAHSPCGINRRVGIIMPYFHLH